MNLQQVIDDLKAKGEWWKAEYARSPQRIEDAGLSWSGAALLERAKYYERILAAETADKQATFEEESKMEHRARVNGNE